VSSNAGEVCDRVAERHVVLIGLPRAGRTSIARLLAKVLERPFAEADEVLELTTGCPLPRLRRQRGEAEVRHLEGRLLAQMLGRCAPLVISAPEATEVAREIRSVAADSAVVVWMRDRVRLPGDMSALGQELADRVVDVEVFRSLDGAPEPFIVGHILELLAASDLPGPVRLPTPPPQGIFDGQEAARPRLDDELAALYHEVADVTVDVEPFHPLDDDPTGAIVRRIVDLLALGETDADAKE
jgi:Shikimate kinase